MRCYVDAKGGVTEDAVAVCSRCGMGLCMKHAHELRVSGLKVGVGNWTGESVPAMLIFCEACSAMYGSPAAHAAGAVHAG